jgi:hypothetical protein
MLAFDAPNIRLEVTVAEIGGTITDVNFQVFQAELAIDFDGRVSLDGQVVASATIAGNFVDLGDKIRDVLLQKIAEGLPPQLSDPALVKRALLGFLANLMRLNDVEIKSTKTETQATGQILDIAIANRTLVASYYLVPVQPQNIP